MPPAIRCTNLFKRYDGKPPVDAVRGLDLTIEQGECFGLLGPNGAGKTTTIEILEGLMPATSGDVEVLGLRWGKHDEQLREQMGISFQETRLSEKLTVRETITLFRALYRQGLEPDEVMAQVSLQEKADARVGKLSGGQKQRLAVACALVGDPQLLFLDEPTTGLDPASRRELWEIIRDFRAKGRTVLITTHYMDEAQRLCDRVAIVDHGKVIAEGTPKELIESLGGDHIVEFNVEQNGAAVCDVIGQLSREPTVKWVRQDGPTVFMSISELHLVLPILLESLRGMDCRLTSLATHQATLEDVFVKLAGRHFSDEGANDR